MKNDKLILTAAVAIVASVGVALLAGRSGMRDVLPEAIAKLFPHETSKFLVARRNLNMGDLIKNPEDMFEQKEFAKEAAPCGGLVNLDDLNHWVIKIPRRAGDPIHEEDLIKESYSPSPNQLPAGYKCVGLRIDLGKSVAHWATLPLTRVDVISTIRREDTGESVRVLLENALLLAIDSVTTRSDYNPSQSGNIVMLAAPSEDCLRLDSVADKGVLTLVQRATVNGKPILARRGLDFGELVFDPDDAFEVSPHESEDLGDWESVFVLQRRKAGEAIRTTDVYRLRKPAVATKAKLERGHRVVGFRSSLGSMGGWVTWPNSMVDLINTIRRGDKGEARFLIEKVRVIDVEEDPGSVLTTILVDLSAEQWRQLCATPEIGTISVALRKSDAPVEPFGEVTGDELRNPLGKLPPLEPVAR
ncbi:MAG TPA: hypothetical protein VHR72_04570 [Gemmataceae bacterium]|jgi:Flp pilus assembly protein CpaB|nr:hypothetical protein [Gemmataceae bacterium]